MPGGAPDPRTVEVHVVGGKAELLEVCPHGRRGDTVVPQVADRGVTVTLRELLPVVAEEQPVMDDFREHTPERTCNALLEHFVGTVVGASDDVRDPHLHVVGDRRELVGGGAVRPDQCHAVQPERAVGVAHRASLALGDVCRSRMDCASFALPHRPPVPRKAEPLEIGDECGLAPLETTRRVGVVDSQREGSSVCVGKPPVRHRGERVAEVQRPGRARREADANGHRANLATTQASIGTWPGSAATLSSQARIAG